MIELHYFPGNVSLVPHILLEELGLDFKLRLVDRAAAAHKSPAYLRMNPNGLIPLLVDGDFMLYETAATCLHLADVHSQSKGSRMRRDWLPPRAARGRPASRG